MREEIIYKIIPFLYYFEIMEDINWNQATIELTASILNGMLERETGWASKIISDVEYKKLAHHSVSLALETIKELRTRLSDFS